MSREVDTEDLSSLSEEDLRYLHDRSRITTEQFAEATGVDEDDLLASIAEEGGQPVPLEEVPNTGDANTAGLDQVAFEKRVARMAKAQTPEEEEEEEGEELEYSEMSNDDLRAELAARDLPVEGKKTDLIARLEEDDAT